MEIKKIPAINDEFDVKLLLFTAKKNFFYIIIFLVISLVFAFLYLRYTYPEFETKTVIQLDVQNEADKFVLFQQEQVTAGDIANRIELLRSPVFLKRALLKLPLGLSYYTKGTVLNYEQYKCSPYDVSYTVKNRSIYNIPLFLNFIDQNRVNIGYDNNGFIYDKTFSISDTINLPEVKLFIKVLDFKAIKSAQGVLDNDYYYFVLNDPDNIAQLYYKSLNIKMLNEAAKTIEIVVKQREGAKAADIANIIAQEFLEYDVENKAEGTNKVITYIDDQISKKYVELYEAENRLDSFKLANGIKLDSTDVVGVIAEKSKKESMENESFLLGNDIKILKSLQNELSENSNDLNIYKISAIITGSQFQGAISSLLTNLQDLLLKKEQLLYEVTTKSGQIEAINYQIKIRKKLLLESTKIIIKNTETIKQELDSKLKGMDLQITSAAKNINNLEYNKLLRYYTINQTYFNELIQKRAEYELEKAGYVSKNIILEQAKIPENPISPIKKNVYGIAFFAALLLGIILIAIKYVLFNEILSIQDISKYTNTPILGIVPKYRDVIPVSQLIVDKHPKSLIAESLRSIRTNLQFLNNQPGSKLIAFTSTISGEGKTFLAINLAGIIAFSGKKVIVIDFDLRKPKIHAGFGVSNKKGISTILSRRDEVDNCINHSDIENLEFITAGPVPPNPSELIFSDYTTEMLEYLKTKYDYIIIDNPPVGLVTDGMKSLSIADYPIYVFKTNYSKKFYIENLNRLVGEGQFKNLSLILNAAEPIYLGYSYKYKQPGNYGSSYGYGYGYGFGYGFGYGYGYFDEETSAPKKKSFTDKILIALKLKKK
jgi:capsular exopolysaccharide synthesis family protein